MSLIETQDMKLFEHLLDLTAQRQALLASNISNIDTPGYKTRDLDFRQEMLKLLQSPEDKPQPNVRNVEGLLERPDGNNVSLDREGMLLAQTQLQFRMGIQLLKGEMHQMQLAINEGK